MSSTDAEHRHAHPNLVPVEGRGFGVDRWVDMTSAAALIGARLARCGDCQRSMKAEVLSGDPLVLAALARHAYSSQASAGPHASAPTRMIRSAFCESGGLGLGPPDHVAFDAITSMTQPQRGNLLEDTLGVWTALIRQDEAKLGVPPEAMIFALTPDPGE